MNPKFDVYWLSVKLLIVLPFGSKKLETYGMKTPLSMVMSLANRNIIEA